MQAGVPSGASCPYSMRTWSTRQERLIGRLQRLCVARKDGSHNAPSHQREWAPRECGWKHGEGPGRCTRPRRRRHVGLDKMCLLMEVCFRRRGYHRVCALSLCHVPRDTNDPALLAPDVAYVLLFTHYPSRSHDKGKPAARRGRKVYGSPQGDSRAAEWRALSIDQTFLEPCTDRQPTTPQLRFWA